MSGDEKPINGYNDLHLYISGRTNIRANIENSWDEEIFVHFDYQYQYKKIFIDEITWKKHSFTVTNLKSLVSIYKNNNLLDKRDHVLENIGLNSKNINFDLKINSSNSNEEWITQKQSILIKTFSFDYLIKGSIKSDPYQMEKLNIIKTNLKLNQLFQKSF